MSSRSRDISGLAGSQRNPMSFPKGKNYLLVIAIDEYVHLPKLYNCVKDADDITQQLVYKYNFKEEYVVRLFNEKASLDNIYMELLKMSHSIKEEDNLVIYFSGHGFFDKDNQTGHLIPVSAEKGKVWDYLSNANFISWIRAIKSKHTLVILDSCFSGSLFSTKNVAPTYSERVANFKSRWGIAAGRVEVVDDGLHGENSPFATAILNFLKKNEAKKFPVSDLVQYVKKVTATNSNQTPIGGPIKNLGDEGGEFIFEQQSDVKTEWKAALSKNSVEGYESFIFNFPESTHIAEAKQNLLPLKEDFAWKKIMATPHAKLDDINEKQRLLTEYKFNYPKGKYNIKANELLIHLNNTEEVLAKKWSREQQSSSSQETNEQKNTPTQSTDENQSAVVRNETKTLEKTVETSIDRSFVNSTLFKALAGIGLLSIFVGLGSFFLGNGKISDKKAFDKLQGSTDIELMTNFIYDYPDSRYIADVQEMKADISYWNKVVDKNEASGYKAYLDIRPNGMFAEKAKNAFANLKEKETNDNKTSNQTISSPTQNAAPSSPDKIKSQKNNPKEPRGKNSKNGSKGDKRKKDGTTKLKPSEYEWEKIKNTTDIEVVSEYISKYGRTPSGAKAQRWKAGLTGWEKVSKYPSLRELDNYIYHFPNSPYIKEAKEIQMKFSEEEKNDWDIAKKLNTIESYKTYMKKYRVNYHHSDARKRMQEIEYLNRNQNAPPMMQQSSEGGNGN